MPFAVCRRCHSSFVVGSEQGSASGGLCPYCGQPLEPLTHDELRREVERQRKRTPREESTEAQPPWREVPASLIERWRAELHRARR